MRTSNCWPALGESLMIGNTRSNIGFMRLLALVIVVVAGGCSRMEEKQLSVGSVTYAFPADHIEAFTNPGEGEPYVRLRPPGSQYDLIYSARARYRTNWTGEDTPLVSSINDHRSRKFEQFGSPNAIIVCRSDQPFYSCGLQIVDNVVVWSVVFNRDQVPNGDMIRESAAKTLKTYRR